MKAQAKLMTRKTLDKKLKATNDIIMNVCVAYSSNITNMKQKLLEMDGKNRFGPYGKLLERQMNRAIEQRKAYREARTAIYNLTYEDDEAFNHLSMVIG